ncbi:heat shock 70 kDa protein II-like [Amphibalanus amphitrite]|uniref:heat shock 70 kDa protein II-like n=1 Tax=Amphibalanus amphitrite TaxID=1232801 RepID=UPI001C90B66B|nr:heat shock 70 kDa protein II-like [Amphibalanus amphitrite]
MTSPTIGIDLGTTYSCVAVFQHGKVEIIANDEGALTTPSCVAFTDTERIIGEVAVSQAVRNPENTVFDVKRMMGRPFSDPTVQEEMKNWPFAVVNDRGNPAIKVEYKGERRQFSPEEISSMILGKMKETAEAYLGEPITDAVVTVPAYFNNRQRSATMDAGKIAGLKIKRIINEPTAAALAYGLDKNLNGEKTILVFDLGGGTFDVSILKISSGPRFQVLSTAGETHLGGQDFDNRLVKYFADEFKKQHKKDLTESRRAMRKLKAASEQAKRTLSSSSQARVDIDSLYRGIHFSCSISRSRFEKMCGELFRRTLDSVEQALSDATLKKSSIDDVVMVGGSTRIPKVQQLLEDFFDGKRVSKDINPDEAVACGAALQGAILGNDASKLDLIGSVTLQDVIPLSLGIEVNGFSMMKMLERNTEIPACRSEQFSFGSDNQTSAQVKVLEGERVMTSDNNVIGEFLISGLVERPRGEPGIKVTFDVNADGILRVSAVDTKKSDNVMHITIAESNGRLSAAEVDRMMKEAEQFREEDDALRKRVNVRNELEGYVIMGLRTVDQAGDDASEEDKKTARSICNEVLEWLEKNRLAELDELTYWLQSTKEKLSPLLQKLNSGDGSRQYTPSAGSMH